MKRSLVVLLAVATGMSIADIYYAQPLLELIRGEVGLGVAQAGMIATCTQLGFALGLFFLVPLGDLVERRALAVAMAGCASAALAGMACSSGETALLLFSLAIGVTATVGQVLVTFAADLAPVDQRGRVVGTVMSGLLLGILLARTVAGAVAQAFGWRAVFVLAAVGMFALAWVLRKALPKHPPSVRFGYVGLMKSTLTIFREEPVLRLRALYGVVGFGLFSVLWTPLSFLLSASPYRYAPGTIGLFGLAGAAGALAASWAGHQADRGNARRTTLFCVLLLVVSWLPLYLGRSSLAALLLGIVFLDWGVQALHITSQSEIYRLRSEARSRLTSAYMTCIFLGGVAGSSASTFAYAALGWTGVALVGAVLAFVGVGVFALREFRDEGC